MTCAAATYWKWREGKARPIPGNSPNDRLRRGPDFQSSQEGLRRCLQRHSLRAAVERAAAPLRFQGMAESIGPMWSQTKTKTMQTGERGAASRWSAPRPSTRTRRKERALYPSSTMSSGRLFLDRVARQQSPSPLHRQPELNMRPAEHREKGDISTLRNGGHFYFALTGGKSPPAEGRTICYDSEFGTREPRTASNMLRHACRSVILRKYPPIRTRRRGGARLGERRRLGRPTDQTF
jgi:hypothetical protein